MIFYLPNLSLVLDTRCLLCTLLFLLNKFTYFFRSLLVVAQKLVRLSGVKFTVSLFLPLYIFLVQFLYHIVNLGPVNLILGHSVWSMLNCANVRQIARKLTRTCGAVLILRDWLFNQARAVFLYFYLLLNSVSLLFRLFYFFRVTFLMIFITLQQVIIN